MGYIESLLGRNEQIVFTTRQHWVRILPPVLGNSALAAIILAVTIGLSILFPFLLPWIMLLTLVLIYPLWRLAATGIFWYNERYLITNRRVIQMEGVFSKMMSDSSLEKVTDVVLEQSAIGRLLGYGDVEILTASEVGISLFRTIADPVGFKTQMLDQKEALSDVEDIGIRAKRALETEDTADIPEIISELDELRQRGILTDEEFQAKKKELLDQL